MKGHKKTVHGCHFIDDQNLVSLSIDGEMKLWNVNTGECLKTYNGHKNRSAFVGLSTNSTHIVYGSEDNNLYGYCKYLSRHITTYKFDMLSATNTNVDNHYVCSTCWKPHYSVILAANSQAYIVILELQ